MVLIERHYYYAYALVRHGIVKESGRVPVARDSFVSIGSVIGLVVYVSREPGGSFPLSTSFPLTVAVCELKR